MDIKQLLGYLDTCNKPEVTAGEVCRIMSEVYGLEVTESQELDSYIDRNFRIKAMPTHDNSQLTKTSPRGYVLKVLNASDSGRPGVPAAQLDVMDYLNQSGIVCPDVVRTKQGQSMGTWETQSKISTIQADNNNDPIISDARRYVVFLCTYLTGEVLYAVRPYSLSLSYSCGLLAGKVDKALLDFPLPDALVSYQSVWDLRSTLNLRHMLHVIPSHEDKELVQDIIGVFEEDVLANEAQFKQGVIHGDFSDHNILVRPAANKDSLRDSDFTASAIVDFGDTSVSCYVYELGILICYMMLDSRDEHFWDVGGHVMAGYLKNMGMNESEWGVVRECAAIRMCQSLVMGAYTHSIHPSNQYVTVTSRRGWDCLRKFWSFSKNDLLVLWKSVIESYSPS